MGCREAIFVDELSAIDFPIFLPVSYFSYFLSNHATGHPGKAATKFLAFYLVWDSSLTGCGFRSNQFSFPYENPSIIIALHFIKRKKHSCMNYKFLTFMSEILNIKWSARYNDNEDNINNSNNYN